MLRSFTALLTLTLALLVALPGAYATPSAPPPPLPDLLPTLLKTLTALAAVAALAFLSLRYLLPRLLPAARQRRDTQRDLVLLDRLDLAPRRSVLLLQARGHLLLLTSSEAGLQHLTLLPPHDPASFHQALQDAAHTEPTQHTPEDPDA